jgi:NifU-like protein involved in Fe-S cluster formation
MYSEVVVDHFQHPRNVGELADASAVGKAGVAGQGNHMVLYLRLKGDRIVAARFQTYGCLGVIASGSVLTEYLIGKSLAEARALRADTLNEMLGGLPLGREHCAQLAVVALTDALEQIRPV